MNWFNPIVLVYCIRMYGWITYPCLLLGFAAGLFCGWMLFG